MKIHSGTAANELMGTRVDLPRLLLRRIGRSGGGAADI